MYKSLQVILTEFINTILIIENESSWFFSRKTGSIISATGKEGEGSSECANVTLPRKKNRKRSFSIFENKWSYQGPEEGRQPTATELEFLIKKSMGARH
jgi:hypothetical protein